MIIVFQVTVKNVGDVFFRHSVVNRGWCILVLLAEGRL